MHDVRAIVRFLEKIAVKRVRIIATETAPAFLLPASAIVDSLAILVKTRVRRVSQEVKVAVTRYVR